MRRRSLVTALSLPLLPAAARAAAPAPVVLELFTSQGCSSCPPADAFLGELVRTPNVIGLAFHVDYWNSLGWRDPHARPEWTERQRAYARALNDDVYTPAMVVNGGAIVVGSDRSAVRRAMERAAPAGLAVTLTRGPSGLEGTIAPTQTPVLVSLATYDGMRTTRVGAGENSGRELTEYKVVRDLVPVAQTGGRVTLPPIDPALGAVLLVRDALSRVVGAADLPPARTG